MAEHPMGPFDGGIWVPKDRINNTPRIYYYFGFKKEDALKAGGVVTVAILATFEGDITFMPPVDKGTFLDAISITNLPLE